MTPRGECYVSQANATDEPLSNKYDLLSTVEFMFLQRKIVTLKARIQPSKRSLQCNQSALNVIRAL